MKFLAVLITIFLLTSCSNKNNLPNTLSPTEKVATKTNIIDTVSPMGIDKDPKTGAYKQCLRPQDYPIWNSKIQNLRGKSIEQILYENPRNKAYANLNSLGNHLFGQALAPITMAGGLIQNLNNVSQALKGQSTASPICGNWCGAGYPRPDQNPDVTDPLDEVCRIHDICYRKFGKGSCQCDQLLANLIMRDRNYGSLNPAEFAMISYFQSSPCIGGCKKINGIRWCSKLSTR